MENNLFIEFPGSAQLPLLLHVPQGDRRTLKILRLVCCTCSPVIRARMRSCLFSSFVVCNLSPSQGIWGNQSINNAQYHLFVSLKVNNSGRHERECHAPCLLISVQCKQCSLLSVVFWLGEPFQVKIY